MLRGFIRNKNRVVERICFFETLLNVKLLVCISNPQVFILSFGSGGFHDKTLRNLRILFQTLFRAYIFARTPFKLAALEILQTEEEFKTPFWYSVSRS